jgi:imidazolonepropionase-like amidohydrolase
MRGARFLWLWLAAVSIGAASLAQVPGSQPVLAIVGATVIDGTGSPALPRTVIVRGNTIEDVPAGTAAPPEGATVVDGKGRFLIPGLWDMHVHLAVRPEPQLAERIMLPLFLAHGIVGVRDMGGPLERVLPLREQVKSHTLTGPRILTPGPFLDGPGDADPTFQRVPSAGDAKRAIDDLLAAGVDFLKIQANLSIEAYTAIATEARARGAVLAGHVPVAVDAEQVIAAGQRSLEHISPALVGDAGLLFACSSKAAELRAELRAIERDRAAAPAQAVAAREAALRQQLVDTFDSGRARTIGASIRRGGAWIVPTLIWSRSVRPLAPGDDGSMVPLEYVPAATRGRWQQRRAAYLKAASAADFEAAASVARVSQTAVGALHAAGAAVLAGTDTFDGFVLPGTSLHQELALLVGAGLTPLEALQAATKNAAEYRGAAAREGTIQRGKRADLVLLDANPLQDIANVARIRTVVADGRLYTRADLDSLLDLVRAAAR